MFGRVAVLVVASLTLIGCVSDTPGLDLYSGVWGGQSLNPPPNLVRVDRPDLVGRPISSAASNSPMVIHHALVDPATGQPQYVAAASDGGTFIIMPMAGLHVTPQNIWTEATPQSLAALPHENIAEFEQRYPQMAAVPPLAPVASGLPPVPLSQQLVLQRRGSVVGLPAVDSLGQPIGGVEAVAMMPGTGEVRYAIIGGPSFGLGSYVAVPASNTQFLNGRVVVNSTLASLTQMPRYHSEVCRNRLAPSGRIEATA